jgi:Kef-type K+ transport system membrane component KefB
LIDTQTRLAFSVTHFIGVHTVLGAFVAGILIGESPILTNYIDAQLRGLIFLKEWERQQNEHR